MKLEDVLIHLQELLESWGISTTNWILIAHYASQLLGYNVKVRKGHLALVVNASKIPWKIGDELETYPPKGSKLSSEYNDFIKKTDFDFDIEPFSEEDYQNKDGDFVLYKLLNSKEIRVQTPVGAIKGIEKMISLCDENGWGVEKIIKVKNFVEEGIEAFLEKHEIDNAQKYKQLLEGDLFQEKYRKYLTTPKTLLNKNGSLIKGIAASKGVVEGIVKVILDAESIKTFADNQILITTMTSPKFTAFMPKVIGIVTDLGGMLCHAAILAREQNIPCIVGAQIATKVLKDGDLVRLDADSGVVKILTIKSENS